VAITVPDSPTPFTPSGFPGDGVSISWVSKQCSHAVRGGGVPALELLKIVAAP
jgi:hypothetical protein